MQHLSEGVVDFRAHPQSGVKRVGPDGHHLRLLGTTGIDRGYAAVDFPFHLTASALGISIAAQWLVFDPVTLGYGATAKHELRAQ